MTEKLTNCLCNTKLSQEQKLNLATKLADMAIRDAECKQNGHQWRERNRFIDDPTSYIIYKCDNCNIVRNTI